MITAISTPTESQSAITYIAKSPNIATQKKKHLKHAHKHKNAHKQTQTLKAYKYKQKQTQIKQYKPLKHTHIQTLKHIHTPKKQKNTCLAPIQ